jgi:hypothetical protein
VLFSTHRRLPEGLVDGVVSVAAARGTKGLADSGLRRLMTRTPWRQAVI